MRNVAVIAARKRRRGTGGPLVRDTFTRADSTSTLGSAETGQAWTAHIGTWGISGNQAYRVASGGEDVASLNTGRADVDLSVTYAAISDRMRTMVRLSDGSNYVTVQNINGTGYLLYKCVAGVFTQLGATFTTTPASGDTVRILAVGSDYTVYLNGAVIITATDAFNNTATRCGIGHTNSASPEAARWDNFSVSLPSPASSAASTAAMLTSYNALDANVQITHIWIRGKNQTSAGAGLINRWGDYVNNTVAFVPKSGFTNCSIDGLGRVTSEGLEITAASGMGSVPAQGLMWGLVARAGLSNCGMLMVSPAAVGSEFTNADGFYLIANNGVNGGTTACGFNLRPPSGSGYASLLRGPYVPGTDQNPIVGFFYTKQDFTRLKVHHGRDGVDCTRAAATGLTTGDKAIRIGVSDGFAMTSGPTQIDCLYRGYGNPTAAHVKILNDWAAAAFGAISDTRDLLWAAGNSITEQADITNWVAGLSNITTVNQGWSGAQFNGTIGTGGDDLVARLPWLEQSCDFSARRRVIITAWEFTNTGYTPPATMLGYNYTWWDYLRALNANVRLVGCTTPGQSNVDTTSDFYLVAQDIRGSNGALHRHVLCDLLPRSPLDDPAQLGIAPYWSGIHPTLAGQQQMYSTYLAAITSAQSMA